MVLTAAGIRWLERRIARRAPLFDGPAPPLDGGLGVLPFYEPIGRPSRDGIPVLPGEPAQEPATVAWCDLRPDEVGAASRRVHRHGWLARSCWRGELRPALADLETWLGADRPGRGPGWVHTTDLVARLYHWSFALALAGARAETPLRRSLAGSVAVHLDHLDARLCALAPGDPRRSLQLMGLAVGSLAWPALPGSSARTSCALSALPAALQALLDDDGAPRGGGLSLLPELLTHGLLLSALGQANRAPLPLAAVARLRSAAYLLGVVLGPDGRLPGFSDGLPEPLMPLSDGPAAAAVHNAALSFGWSEGAERAHAGALARSLAGQAAVTPSSVPARGEARSLRAFRASGVVLGLSTVNRRPSRLLFQLRAGTGVPRDGPAVCGLHWSVGETAILAVPHPARLAPGLAGNVAHLVPAEPPLHAELLRCRLTERALNVQARAWGGGGGMHHRDVELRGPRLTIEDRFDPPGGGLLASLRAPRVRVGWQLGPAWRLEADGMELVGHAGGQQLRIELDPSLIWTQVRGGRSPSGGWVAGPRGEPSAALLLWGEGPLLNGAAIRCSFSLS